MSVETQHVQLAALQLLQKVLKDGRNLDHALDGLLDQHRDWPSSSQSALKDLSYGTLRFLGTLQFVLDELLNKPLQDDRLRLLMLVALYQLQYGKSAHYAVVDHAVRATQSISPKASGLVNAILRNFLRNQRQLLDLALLHDETRYSFPNWWIDELKNSYGARYTSILSACNLHPPMTLRINHRRTATQDYLDLLQRHDIAARQIEPDALVLDKAVSVDLLPGFHDGLVSVQDAGAQYAARLLDVHDGMRVLDACAAPGGKTAHILEIADANLTAVDKNETRLTRVADNMKRLGLQAELIAGNASRPEDWWDGQPFQRILADVPCSASGVVRRHPDIKWLRRPGDLTGFAEQQFSILQALWRLLAHDGKLLYATCSVFRQENDQVIARFMAQNPEASRLPVFLPDAVEGQLLPDEQHDGFFYALLHKSLS